MKLAPTQWFSPPALRPWLSALVFGVLAYFCITGFSFYRDDNVQRVTSKIFAASATLLLASILGQAAHLEIPARQRWLIVASTCSVLASTLLAPHWPLALDRLQLYGSLALFGLAVYLLHRDDDRPAAWPYLLAIGVVHALVLIEVVFWMLQVQAGDASLARHMPYHYNVRHFGYLGYLAAASAAALSWHSRRLAVTGFVLCVAALFGIVQLGSRGALLGWLAFLSVGVVLMPHRLRLIAAAGSATALAFAITTGLSALDLLSSDSLFARAQQGQLTGGTGRLQLWADVLRAIGERPWLGYGPDGHRVLGCCGAYGPYIAKTSQPHNVVLQLLEEFGLIGTILVGALAARLARQQAKPRGWRTLARENEDIAALIAVLAGMLAFGLVDGPFYYPVPLMVLAALGGLLMAAAHRAARAPRS